MELGSRLMHCYQNIFLYEGSKNISNYRQYSVLMDFGMKPHLVHFPIRFGMGRVSGLLREGIPVLH